MSIQLCTSCGSFRFTKDDNTWSQWKSFTFLTSDKVYAEKVECGCKDRQPRAKVKALVEGGDLRISPEARR